ncbi:MAG: fibro-slime domain-containing protein [Coprococcus sp.]|nr:fibro-slime domain-containing protein [Coprococcus sp.]
MQELLREYLNELGSKQKKRRRNYRIAAIFAVLVVGSVIWALARSGIAMTGEAKCGIEEHTHSEECYEEILICEQEESEGHQHTEACYTTESVLICEQEEGEEHTHGEECYTEESTLTCGQEESEGHQHTDACYESFAACGKEEHIHSELCYIDTDADLEDASIWDEQYKDVEWKEAWGQDLAEAARMQLGYMESEKNYIVAEDESHKGYTRYGQFAESAYTDWDAAFVNFCLHYAGIEESEMFPKEVDTLKWYEEFTKAEAENNTAYLIAPEGYTPAEGDLIFFDKEEEETAFQMGIVSSYDEEKNEIKVIEGNSDNEVKENEYKLDDSENHIFAYIKITEMEAAYKGVGAETETPAEETEGTEGEADEKTEIPMIEKTYEGENFVVTAAYGEDAEIPEEAELVVEQITPDTDEEHFAERESQLQEMMEDENAAMRALLNIGFYVDGEEIEPKSAVKITVQFLDENGLKEGGPITVIHFANEGTELFGGSDATDNTTTFQMDSFSEVGIVEGEAPDADEPGETPDEEPNEAPNETVSVAEDFHYENEAFRIIFHIEGEAALTAKKADDAVDTTGNEGNTADAGNEAEENPTEESNGTADGDTTNSPEGEENQADEESNGSASAEGEDDTAGGDVFEETGEIDEPSSDETGDNESGEAGSDTSNESDENASGEGNESDTPDKTVIEQNGFQFVVEKLAKDSEKYQKFSEFAAANDPESKELLLHVMEYKLYYEGVELDLTNCKVTARIKPIKTAEEYLTCAGVQTLSGDENIDESTDDESKETLDVPSLTLPDVTQASQMAAKSVSSMLNTKDTSGDGAATANAAADAPQSQVKFTVYRMTTDAQIETADDFILEDEDESAGGNSGEEMDEGSTGDENDVSRDETEIELDGDTLAVRGSGTPNAVFSVQYYAYLKEVVEFDSGATGSDLLDIINTSNNGDGAGGNLPRNGTTPNTKKIKIGNDGKILTETELQEVYRSRENLTYYEAPSLFYFDALQDNKGYKLKEVWTLKPGSNKDSTVETDWNRYYYNENLHFTNRPSNSEWAPNESFTLASAYPDTVLTDQQKTEYINSHKDVCEELRYVLINNVLNSETVIRLVYDPTETAGTEENPHPTFTASFYDYDISSNVETNGATKTMHTREGGINSSDNYTGDGVKYAFGNRNAGTAFGELKWKGDLAPNLNKWNYLNAGNKNRTANPIITDAADSYMGCTFKLVKDISSDMKNVVFNDGVNGINNLFGGEAKKGKTSYDNSKLTYRRTGDSYTLTMASVNGIDGAQVNNMDVFVHPQEKYPNIWTNNFWPMDNAVDREDVNFGDNSDVRFNGATSGSLPPSDDGEAHNSYFGMYQQITFTLPDDYVGPLNYYFFGDDDMWVFLDQTLVCDIGGVHSSVGEYVDLWDYIQKDGRNNPDGEKTYTLTFFYTERGASGSSCWIHFTLPKVTGGGTEPEDNLCELKIKKLVQKTEEGETKPYDQGGDFEFNVQLKTADDRLLPDDYSYTKYHSNGTEAEKDIILHSGSGFTLKNGEYVIIRNLPPNVKYEIVEKGEGSRRAQYGGIYYACATDISGKSYAKTQTSEAGSNLTIDPSSYTVEDDSNAAVSGQIPKAMCHDILYTNRFTVYKLPATGGSGLRLYTIVGGLCILSGAGLVYRKRRKEVLRGRR